MRKQLAKRMLHMAGLRKAYAALLGVLQTPPCSAPLGRVWWFAAGCCLFAFLGFYVCHAYVLEDVNMEAMDIPLAVGHMMRAAKAHVSAEEYFQTNVAWYDLKTQNPAGAYAYFGGAFQFSFFSKVQPLLVMLFYPFVLGMGVTTKTVIAYSTTYCAVTWLLLGILGYKLYGKWAALVASTMPMLSLVWLIHTKVGYAAHMPSAALMVGLAIVLCQYLSSDRWWLPLGAGGIIGLMYLVGWLAVVFGGIFVVGVLLLCAQRGIRGTVRALALVAAGAVGVVGFLTVAYSAFFNVSCRGVHEAILSVMFGRFQQGGVPGQELSFGGQLSYAFHCMFFDMRTYDHLDKCLEGAPAIAWPFSFCFLAGLLYAIKERTLADRVVLMWLLAVFGVLGCAFTFTHRYALLGMPAMALLASRGVLGISREEIFVKRRCLQKTVAGLGLCALALGAYQTHHQYFCEYIGNKPADFELDRARGHARFGAWLKEVAPAASALVVLNDATTCPHTSFLFNTFGYDYRFVYWNNYFTHNSTAGDVLRWEKQQFKRYERLIYLFSTQMIRQVYGGQPQNDWRAFLLAHPGLVPAWRYAYDGRPPLLFGFVIERTRGSEQPKH